MNTYTIFFSGYNNKNKGRKKLMFIVVYDVGLRSTRVIYMPGCGAVESATVRAVDKGGDEG
jgi:hypothetical protein